MDPLEQARKIGRIATDPRTFQLHSQHEALVKRVLSAMGESKDAFIKRFLQRHFPYALADRIEKFGVAAPEDVSGAVEALFEACGIICHEYPVEKHGKSIRATAFIRQGLELARLEMGFRDGALCADEFRIADSEVTYFGYDTPAVRIFFWRLCQSKHEPLADISRRHYAIRFRCDPEQTLESINFETARVGLLEDYSESGEQQRPPDDRG